MSASLLRQRFEIIWAITRKDLKIAFRYPKNFVAIRLIEPLRIFILLGLVYQSFFVFTENLSIGHWSRGNYVPTLLLGAIFYSGFSYAYYRFRTSFLNEKYWRTIQIFLTTPVSKLSFLMGTSIAMVIELLIPISFYLAVLHLLYHIPFFSLLSILAVFYLMLFGLLGFSLMQGAFVISNENYLFIFDYIFAGWTLASCFYYSVGAIPAVFRFVAFLNPIYHAVEASRAAVFHHLSYHQIVISVGYLLFFSIVAPFVGALFFRKVVRELGVRGF